MKIILPILLIISLSQCNSIRAQTFDGLRISIKAGGNYSTISNLQTMILSEPYFTDYTLTGKHVFGFTGGMGINSEIKNSIISVNLDVLYSQQGSGVLIMTPSTPGVLLPLFCITFLTANNLAEKECVRSH